ncbi:MAG TPA: putative quinol monooxygenase [Edaphobacter sp.]|jgi:quinol monooxygenase YgiN|nr:putative quinol monooxygenase [Edaphobacter sp.]
MLSFTVRMTFDQADRDAVDEVLRHLTASTRREPGCVSYIPHFVEGEGCTVLIYEQYVNEAALEHHRGSPHFHQYAIGGLYQMMKERQLENLSAVC